VGEIIGLIKVYCLFVRRSFSLRRNLCPKPCKNG